MVLQTGNTNAGGNKAPRKAKKQGINMKCGYPVDIGGNLHPCGRCMPCRINTKRMWTGRIIGESVAYKNNSTFLTMTYDEEHKPKDNSLSFRDLQGYLKRLRSGSLGELRYFAVGEYGDKTARPHYHAIIFNAPAETWEQYLIAIRVVRRT
ncbi:replication initiator protein [Microviridae sp.]|nr:replication initiator protein [Microviridae sp.]